MKYKIYISDKEYLSESHIVKLKEIVDTRIRIKNPQYFKIEKMDRCYSILRKRINGESMHDISESHNISRSRIYQIEHWALELIRQSMDFKNIK